MIIFWKDYFHNKKMHIFLAIQILFIFALVNLQVSSITERYNQLSFAEECGRNIYIYENSMACLEANTSSEYFFDVSKMIKHMDGVEEIGYQALLDCTIKNMEDNTDISSYYISPLVKSNMRLRLKSGEWFQEDNSNELSIIIGGNLSKKYHTGDTITLKFENQIEKTAYIIGDLGISPYILNLDAMGSVQTFMNITEKDENVILTDNEELFNQLEYPSYPFMSLIVKLQENPDLSSYETYGHMISFYQLFENTKQECKDYVHDCITRNIIWLIVILFGVAGTSYLTAQKNRYIWGIYSLMGMSGESLMRNMIIQNSCTYLLGSLLSVWIYPYLKQKLFYSGEWTITNWYATGILFFVLIIISCFCNRYIYTIKPKEILQQTRG